MSVLCTSGLTAGRSQPEIARPHYFAVRALWFACWPYSHAQLVTWAHSSSHRHAPACTDLRQLALPVYTEVSVTNGTAAQPTTLRAPPPLHTHTPGPCRYHQQVRCCSSLASSHHHPTGHLKVPWHTLQQHVEQQEGWEVRGCQHITTRDVLAEP